MQTNPIPGVLDTLKDAKFDEEQRMAITTAITEMQYPLLEAIEKLNGKFDRMDTRLRLIELVAFGLLLPVLFIAYRIVSISG